MVNAQAIAKGALLAEEYLAKRPDFMTPEIRAARRAAREARVAELDRRAERRQARAAARAAEELRNAPPERKKGRAPLYPGPPAAHALPARTQPGPAFF